MNQIMDSPYFQGFFTGLKPDPRLTVTEWADQKRILPAKATKEAGQWRTSRTPYLKDIMDCLSPFSSISLFQYEMSLKEGAVSNTK